MLLCWAGAVAMGAVPGEFPTPEVDFRATVTDDQDVITKCTNVSWEGETSIRAKRGKGVVSIPFEKVRKIVRVTEARKGGVDFQVMLRGGEVVAVTVDSDARLFGVTSFGNYRIEAKNIKEVVFE